MTPREIWLSGSQWPVGLWLVCLIVVAVLVRWLYYRVYAAEPARHLWWLRFAAIGMTLIALADLTRKQFQVELPQLVIAIDNSGSSRFPNDPRQPSVSRMDMIKTVLDNQRLQQLAAQFQLSFWEFGSEAQRLDSDSFRQQLDGSQPSSELGDSLADIVDRHAGKNAAAMLVFSDGATTDGVSLREAAKRATANGLPLFVLGTGSPRQPKNISVEPIITNQRVRSGEPTRLTFDVKADSLNAETINISIVDEQSNEELASTSITVNGEQFSRSISLPIVLNDAGNRQVVVSATLENPVDESNIDDNRRQTSIQVVEGKTRVLIVQDLPSPWFRFLKKTLVRATDTKTGQPAFEVRTLLQSASAQYPQSDPNTIDEFPTLEKLVDFDLIVFGDARHDSLGRNRGLGDTDFRNLKEYVFAHTGNVVFVPGPQHVQKFLAQPDVLELLPRHRNIYLAKESDDCSFGMNQSSDSFGPTRWLNENLDGRIQIRFAMLTLIESGIELAEFGVSDHFGTPPAAISLQRIGGGTVVTHFTNELYRLRFRSDKNLFENYWVRMVTELSADRLQKRDATALLRTDASEYRPEDIITVTADLFSAPPENFEGESITGLLSNESGETRQVVLRRIGSSQKFQASINPLPSDRYQIELSLPSAGVQESIATTFLVKERAWEIDIQNQQTAGLIELAEQSGGVFLDIRESRKIWSRLPIGGWNQVGVARMQPIWMTKLAPLLFAVTIIALLVSEWLLRRRWRLE